MTPDEIYQAALKKWGVQAQLLMVMEEIAEFSAEVSHLLRGRPSYQLEEEYADAKIVMEQFELIMAEIDPDFKWKSQCVYDEKLERLKARVME